MQVQALAVEIARGLADFAQVCGEHALVAQSGREAFGVGVSGVGFARRDDREDAILAPQTEEGLDLMVDPLAAGAGRRAEDDEGFAGFERFLQALGYVAAGFEVGAVAKDGVEFGGDWS